MQGPSPAVLTIPSRPCLSWSAAGSPVLLRLLFTLVSHGMVALWSQFPAAVARPGVWPAESHNANYGAAHPGDLVVAFLQRRLQAQGGQAS
jgi:hypothetical protein